MFKKRIKANFQIDTEELLSGLKVIKAYNAESTF